MTIDEAIKHAEEVAEEQVKRCEKCADEHRQLAEWLKELKQLREQTRWIPVSEKLPEKEDLYLVSVKNEHERRYSKTCWFHGNGNWFARQDVEAWKPLPEPYREEKG